MDAAMKKIFGSQIKILSSKDQVTHIDYGDREGKALVTLYDVFPGIGVILNDFYTSSAFRQVEKQDIIEINHCRQGRFECGFENQKISYLGEGDLALNGMEHLPISSTFPLKTYYGISVIISREEARDNPVMDAFSVDFDAIYDKFDLGHRCFVYHRNEKIEHIFSEMYERLPDVPIEYLRFKMIELFYYLHEAKVIPTEENQYFPRALVEKVKQIRNYMIEQCDKRIPLEQLVKERNMGMTQFKSCFGHIYGDTPYSHMKKYRMNKAAKLLVEENCNINQIAMEVSYKNASKFSEAFQSVMGVTPREYRLQHENKSMERKIP